MSIVSWLLAAIVGIVSFVAGRVFGESEKILSEKRRVYEAFLRSIPHPSELYDEDFDERVSRRTSEINDGKAVLMLYASPQVLVAVDVYFPKLAEAADEITATSPALHPLFQVAAKAQNDVIIEMRRDSLAWSAFAFRGKSRVKLPDYLANRKTTE